jgi:predicted Fe-Mo cluster-binding NifX family protein
MFAPISDCQVLIAGGMGSPALEAARSAGLEVILAGGTIKAALESYLRGTLQGDPSRVHTHHHR